MALVKTDPTSPSDDLCDAVELAREAARGEAGDSPIGEHGGTQAEDGGAVTHLFESSLPGYRG